LCAAAAARNPATHVLWPPLGAAGGALTLTLPILYLQDQLSERPGTAAALMALMKVAGDALAAGSFALGTSLSGYTLAAVLAAVVTLAGAGTLVLADAKRRL
jgi:hypothetical protein